MMFGFKKMENEDVSSHLRETKLRLPLMEIRMCEFCVIEESARCWLKSAGVDYNVLEEHCGWIVLIGALIAMEKAEFYNEIRTKRVNEGIVESYEGFLRQGIPAHDLLTIKCDIEYSLVDNASTKVEERLLNQFHFSKFEASSYLMANYISTWMTNDDGSLNKISDALYQFYLRARDDYFQGKENEQHP